MEEDENQGNLGKRSKEQVISAEKKKKLMKKLARIRLNKSRGNASLFDVPVSAFYEAKIRKLKLNNISLAKSLSEQKQISQSWYDTVISLKGELHDSQESLLRLHYQVKGNGDYEHFIQESVQRRIRTIAEPLDLAVSDTLRDASSFVENLTKVKQLTSSLLSLSNKEKLNFSRRSSHSLLGSRPPLSQNSKSPRKNVVHPMVEGHVLQPATIPIPRMSLEERRRYRLQEQEIGMEAIGELSTSSESESTSSDADDSTSDQIIEEENRVCHMNVEDAINDDETGAESVKSESHDEEGLVSGGLQIPFQTPEDSALGDDKAISMKEEASLEENQLDSGSESPCRGNFVTHSSRESFKEETLSPRKAEEADHACEEDPLEGSSWMHLVKGRSKKRKTKSGKANIRSSGLHFLPDSSSESEEEYLEIPVGKVKHGKVKGSAKNRPSRSKSSKVSLSHLDLLTSKVSKRSKKSANYSKSSIRDSKDTCELNNEIEESSSTTLPSFIINDSQTDLNSLDENSDPKKSPTKKESETITTVENKHPTLVSPNSNLHLEPVVNLTCILDSPMEITECLTGQLAVDTKDTCGSPPKENEISTTKTGDSQNSSNNIVPESTVEKFQSHKTSSVHDSKKTNKYFKTQDSETNKVTSEKQTASCIYDISLMDASQITSCLTNIGKENVPPNINVSSEDFALKIKDISIVVKDIMKTPPSSDVDPNAPFYGFENSCNEQSKNIKKNNSKKPTNEKNKCNGKRKGNANILKKASKKPKKTNISGDLSLSILSSPSVTEDEDVWSPTKKPRKRKTKYSKKNITPGKKLKKHTNETTEKSSVANENCEQIPMTIANGIDVNSDNIIENQTVNPLCEISVDPNTLGTVSEDIFKDVNDIIRKHIKKEIKHIACEAYEVIDLDSEEDNNDPLAMEESELINGRPRRATLKVQSFKEPALNTKMRNSERKKTKKAPRKKNVKT